jgi:hypothetical protein
MNLEKFKSVSLNDQELGAINGGLRLWDYAVAFHNANVATWELGAAVALGVMSEMAQHPGR